MSDTIVELEVEDAPSNASDEEVDRTPPRRWRILAPPRLAGSVGAFVFLWTSFWPTLMPRSFITQGAISGISMAFGYLVFTMLGHIGYRALARREVGIPTRTARLGWLVLGAVATVVVVVGGIWMWPRWQNQQRDLLGMDDLSPLIGVPMLVVALVVATILIVVGRAVGRGIGWIFDVVNRYASRSTSTVITAVVVALLGWVLFTDVVGAGFRSWANRSFGAADEGTAEGVEQPDEPTVSGSPDSAAPWDTLGYQGRTFVAQATDRETLRRFQASIGDSDAAVQDPIRVYAGIDTAEDVDERVDIVVKELERTNAFDREVLVVATATGTGWIDPNSATALELMYGGDTAIASVQYSFLPSWIAFLVDKPRRGRGRGGAVRRRVPALVDAGRGCSAEAHRLRPQPRVVRRRGQVRRHTCRQLDRQPPGPDRWRAPGRPDLLQPGPDADLRRA